VKVSASTGGSEALQKGQQRHAEKNQQSSAWQQEKPRMLISAHRTIGVLALARQPARDWAPEGA
jgi:hypothetical protein